MKPELNIFVDDTESLMCQMAENMMEKFDKY